MAVPATLAELGALLYDGIEAWLTAAADDAVDEILSDQLESMDYHVESSFDRPLPSQQVFEAYPERPVTHTLEAPIKYIDQIYESIPSAPVQLGVLGPTVILIDKNKNKQYDSKERVHSIEPVTYDSKYSHNIRDRSNNKTLRIVYPKMVKQNSKLATRVKRLEKKIKAPELKCFEETFTAATGALIYDISDRLCLPQTKGTANNQYVGNVYHVKRIEILGYPFGSPTATGGPAEFMLVKCESAASLVKTDFGPTNASGAWMNVDKGRILKHMICQPNTQVVKWVHKFKYPLRIDTADNNTLVDNVLRVVLRTGGAVAVTPSVSIRTFFYDG